MTAAETPGTGCYALIAGGGTAGHVQPAIAIARGLVDRGHPAASIELVGSERGIEARLVPAPASPSRCCRAGASSASSACRTCGRWGLVRALGQAWRLVGRKRPASSCRSGATPACLRPGGDRAASHRRGRAERGAGAANRLVSRFAKACACRSPTRRCRGRSSPATRCGPRSWPSTGPRRHGARTKLDIEPGRRLVLVFGGSLGALRINRAAVEAARLWAGRADLHVRHVIGMRLGERSARWPAGAAGRRAGLRGPRVRRRHADLAGRRRPGRVPLGASSSFELLAAGLPSVLVPSPFVTADHQTANARHLARAGAVVVPDAELDGARLVAEVDALLADRPAPRDGAAAAAARPTPPTPSPPWPRRPPG